MNKPHHPHTKRAILVLVVRLTFCVQSIVIGISYNCYVPFVVVFVVVIAAFASKYIYRRPKIMIHLISFRYFGFVLFGF